MKVKTTVFTPLGEFPSMARAARAHGVDRSTIQRRIETLPDQYRAVVRAIEPRTTFTAGAVRWPCTWNQYRLQPESVKEQIYFAWCARMRQDPDSDTAADAFFDDMDQQVEGELNTDDSELEEI